MVGSTSSTRIPQSNNSSVRSNNDGRKGQNNVSGNLIRFLSSTRWIKALSVVVVVVFIVAAVATLSILLPQRDKDTIFTYKNSTTGGVDNDNNETVPEEPQPPGSEDEVPLPDKDTIVTNSTTGDYQVLDETVTKTHVGKKNVILIIADDLGIRDLGCYNPNDPDRFYETPNLDAFASESVLFENAYSAYATCAESRAGIYTGMCPSRLGIVDFSRLVYLGYKTEWMCLRRADNWGRGMQKVPLDATTIPEAFLQHGYRTALIGKWHSGTPEKGQPHDHGFEITIGNKTGLASQISPYRCRPNRCSSPPSNLTQVPDGTMSAAHLTMEAISLMEHFGDNPFFLTLSHYAVHTPIQATDDLVRPFKQKRSLLNQSALDVYVKIDGLIERQTQDHPEYAGLLKSLDDSIGTLLQALPRLGLDNNTIILFASDNGGKSSNYRWKLAKEGKTSNQPFKGAKEFLGDGGIRVPLIIKAPGEQPRRTLFQSHGVDYFPTLLDLAGLPLQPEDHVDGMSLVPAMRGKTSERGKPMFWQDQQECFMVANNESHIRCTDTSYASIFADWKLIKRVYSERNDKDATLELYNIKEDPGERHNLVQNASYAQRLQDMEQMMQDWQRTWFQTQYFERLRVKYNNCT